MTWYVSGPTVLFLAAAVLSLRRAVKAPVTARPRMLLGAVVLLVAAAALVVLDLAT